MVVVCISIHLNSLFFALISSWFSFFLSLCAAIKKRKVDIRSILNQIFSLYVHINVFFWLNKRNKFWWWRRNKNNGFCAMYRNKQKTLFLCVYICIFYTPIALIFFLLWHFLFLVCFFLSKSTILINKYIWRKVGGLDSCICVQDGKCWT
jgi:hypothetical protein